ncbi:MAG: hypothetical protein AB7S38_40620 [Vulcanimicrobiota bacterium]
MTIVTVPPDIGEPDEFRPFWRTPPEGDRLAKLWRVSTTGGRVCLEVTLNGALPRLDLFSDGSALVVYRRCEEPDDQNAAILSPSGELEARFVLGEAIENVLIDERDRFWIGYFDEADFCRFRCFERNGTEVGLESPCTFDLPTFNFTRRGLLCTYQYYNGDILSAVSSIEADGRHRLLKDRIDGVIHAVVESPQGLILDLSDIHREPERRALVHLGQDGEEELSFTWPAEPDSLQSFGRGSVLNFVAGPLWYQLSL